MTSSLQMSGRMESMSLTNKMQQQQQGKPPSAANGGVGSGQEDFPPPPPPDLLNQTSQHQRNKSTGQ